MAAPAWLGAAAGQQGLAGQVNQFLATHAVTWVYAGTQASAQSSAGSGSAGSNGLWIAQSFTAGPGQTAAGYVVLTLGYAGSPSPWSISLQADNGSGAPSGTALVTAQVPREFLSAGGGQVPVMLPAAGLSASGRYWIVAAAQGDAGDYFTWSKSSQSSGASASTDGAAWTAQPYGLLYQVYDQSPVMPIAGTYEDAGARWTARSYTASGVLAGISEYTRGQTAAGYTAVTRTLAYAGNLLSGVS